MKTLVPASTEAFLVGFVLGWQFNAILNSTPELDRVAQHSSFPLLHLRVEAADQAVTWELLAKRGCTTEPIQTRTRHKMRQLITHFFGDTLPFEDAEWVFGTSRHADAATVHVPLLIGHSAFFEVHTNDGSETTPYLAQIQAATRMLLDHRM